MSDRLFGSFDIGLVFALAFGLGLWQLIAVRRSIRRDGEAATKPARDAGAPPVSMERRRSEDSKLPASEQG